MKQKKNENLENVLSVEILVFGTDTLSKRQMFSHHQIS